MSYKLIYSRSLRPRKLPFTKPQHPPQLHLLMSQSLCIMKSTLLCAALKPKRLKNKSMNTAGYLKTYQFVHLFKVTQ